MDVDNTPVLPGRKYPKLFIQLALFVLHIFTAKPLFFRTSGETVPYLRDVFPEPPRRYCRTSGASYKEARSFQEEHDDSHDVLDGGRTENNKREVDDLGLKSFTSRSFKPVRKPKERFSKANMLTRLPVCLLSP